jgi:hypothetical protein
MFAGCRAVQRRNWGSSLIAFAVGIFAKYAAKGGKMHMAMYQKLSAPVMVASPASARALGRCYSAMTIVALCVVHKFVHKSGQ